MKKRMNCFIPQVVGACALATAATTSSAFFEESSFYLVPSVGYHMTDELDHYDKLEKSANAAGAKFEFDDGPDFGIAFGFQTTPYTAVEFAYNYSTFDMTLKGGGADVKESTNFHYVHVDALYYFSNVYENDFSFYIPLGIGYAKNDPESSDEKDGGRGIEDTDINFGVGAQYRFSEHFRIRGDIRGLYGISQSNFDAIAQVGVSFMFGLPGATMAEQPIKSADIRFKLNSTDVVNPNDPDIAELAEAVRNHPNAKIKILAYSSKSGTSAYNMQLSQRRADKLKSILIDKFGVEENRIYTKAFGDEGGVSMDRHAVAIVEW